MDPLLDALSARGLDPADGMTLVALDALARRPVDPGLALVLLPPTGRAPDPAEAEPPAPAEPDAPSFLPPALPGRAGHGADALVLLRRLYPADHPVHPLDGGAAIALRDVDEAWLVAAPRALPRLPARLNVASPFGLPWLVARLRAPGGCPWDREQDHLTLRPFLLEEAYEVYDALEAGSTPDLAGELGDLLLQVVLHAQYGAEAGVFDLADVYAAVTTKIIRRHPHVFAGHEARTADEVLVNWERIKEAERAADGAEKPSRPHDPAMPEAFAGLSRSLPALAYADEMQARAASLGYDWPDVEGVIDKVAEEATELLAADDAANRAEEYGDLLFVLVNLARKLDVDPEAALRGASRKFAARFARVERLAGERGLELRALGLDALDALWQDAKLEEAEERAGAPRSDQGDQG
jgi:MazG family protein